MPNYYGRDNNVYMSCAEWERTRRTIAEQHCRQVHVEWKRRAAYFRRQRTLGFFVFAIGALMILIGHFAGINFLGGLGLAAGLLGLYLVVAKHMILVDEYYQECQTKMTLI